MELSIFGYNALLSSDASLFSHRLIRGIDRSDFLRCERHKFRRHTTRHHPVRMIFENQLVVVAPQGLIVHVGCYAQNLIRIGFNDSAYMARFDVVELRAGKSKVVGDAS